MAHASALHGMTVTPAERRGAALLRTVVMGVISFLTFVDLFAAQAILPTLVKVYQVTPAAMGFAVNASTIVTTNLPFKDWGGLFHNAAAASAIADRLVHKGTLVSIKGKSRRSDREVD